MPLVQLDRDPSPRRSHKLPALVRDHDLDTAKRISDTGTEEPEETEEKLFANLNSELLGLYTSSLFSLFHGQMI